MAKPRIVVVGSSNTDMIIKMKRIPKVGETVLGGEFLIAAGGKGANQAVAAARAGGQVSLVARVGDDRLGAEATAGFRREGIDVKHVTRDPRAASGAALILVDQKGQNCIAVAGGANNYLSAGDVRAARKLIGRASVLLMQLETPLAALEAAAEIAEAQAVTVILNPAPARALPNTLLRRVSILTPNELEAELLTGIKLTSVAAAGKAAMKLRRRGVQTVIITLGANGALLASEQGSELVPSFKVKAVDTTAAGDVFNGALAVGLAEGRALSEAVHMANAAAAISVTRLGAQPSAPRRVAILKRLRSRPFRSSC